MTVTEKEAQEKICPVARLLLLGNDYKCIGSDCMWWVWINDTTDDIETRKGSCKVACGY